MDALEILFTEPSKQKNSISISNESFGWRSRYSELDSISHYDKNLDSVWWRRARKPYVPESLHEDDIMFVRRENTIYHDSIPYILDSNAWWVNPVSSHQKTRSKIVQLKIAQQCDFQLPETLISNSPEERRKIPGHQLPLTEIELSNSIKAKIIEFMKNIGVVFGCFDFIVTPDDEIIFLEINGQGQFLWVEEILPDLYYLDMFSDFLINKTFDFTWKKNAKSLSALDFDQKAFKIVEENKAKHVYLNQIKKVS